MKNYMFLILSIILLACANIISPSGGEKDVNPPVLLSASPPNKSVNFNSKNINLVFDEYVQLKNIDDIKISPICEPKPEIVVRGKKIQIQLFCPLDSLVTYTINFGQSIIDLNEGNVLKNFTYIFSSGEKLDSLSLGGDVKEVYPNKKISNVLVGLYKKEDLSTPHYYGFSDESGKFLIENIKAGEYLLFSFMDNNQNFQHDFGELASIPEKLINFNQQKNLDLFYEQDSMFRINAININQNTVRFEHKLLRDSIVIVNASGFWNRDSLFSDFWFKDSPRFIKYKFDGRLDSIAIDNTDGAQFNLKPINNIEAIIINQELLIKSNTPIKSINSNKFRWSGATESLNPTLINVFTIQIPVDSSMLKMEKLIIDTEAVVTENLLKNDSTVFLFNFNSDQYGSLNLISSKLKDNMIVELFNESGVVKKRALLDSTKIKYIHPGNYYVRVFHDEDKNYHWTPGNIDKQKFGEPIYVYSEPIKIKPNWDIEILINTNNIY